MKKNAFTLIELLITIAIISIVTVIGTVTYTNTRSQARDGIRKTDLTKLATALELYAQQNNLTYMDGTPGVDGNCTSGDTTNFYTNIAPYMVENTVPKDPQTGANYCYVSINNGQGFRLFAKLENCNDPQNPICYYTNYNYSITSDNTTIAYAPGDTLEPTPQPTATPTPSPTPSPTPTSIPSPSPSPSASPTPSPTLAPTYNYAVTIKAWDYSSGAFVNANGTKSGYPTFDLRDDNNNWLASFTVNSVSHYSKATAQTFTREFSLNSRRITKPKIVFTNDYWSASADRNLGVDYISITIDGITTTYQSEANSTFSYGSWVNDCWSTQYAQQEHLDCGGGYFKYNNR